MYHTISNTIKIEVIKLHEYNNVEFNIPRYERIIDMVVRAIMEDDNISIIDKLTIYYASLLYPANNIRFYSFDYENVRAILGKVDIPKNISIDDIIKNIKITEEKQGIIYNAIQTDDTNPTAVFDKAIFLYKKDIPLYTRYTPYIKDRSQIASICTPQKKFNSFIEYIYYIGLFLHKNIETKNKYLLSLLDDNKERMIRLCMLYGEKECIEMKDIREWISKN